MDVLRINDWLKVVINVGGYEMRDLTIPNQSVLLDYCGCKKHWHKSGITTGCNVERLVKVASDRRQPD
ncbi:hypothetical protein QA601_10140 [Chitinispirillales bacterium ANBcel5]|uniref:hypothetical protein n=1 Tax=Cellulosispirillum alkaliphilum TaxID=3039283 RepID=UPI002A50A632|nr:hypothetical protein [Chitinispirillales bacterium ANBcel5]